MKKLAVYAAAAAATMSISVTIPASAAVKMFVVNGNSNSTCFGGGGQNIDISDVLSSLYSNLPSSFPSCGNTLPEADILRPNLPAQNIQAPDCWWNLPNQNLPGFDCPDQNQPGINCPDQNLPDQNWPGFDCPGQNEPSQPGNPDQPEQPGQPGNPDQPEQPGQPDKPDQPGQPGQPDKPVNPNPVPPSQGGGTNTSYVQQVINLVNEERAKAGLPSVQSVDSITQAANVRAQEIVTNFSHTRPDGSSFSTALRQAGVSYMGSGENIAYGQRTPEEVMDGWMNSAGHRANILNSNYKNIGIGFYEANGVKYWVQLFTY